METRIGRLCDRIIEAGWLLAVVLAPVYFNVRASRVFEPDKSAMLTALALVMVAAWLISAIERIIYWIGGRLGWTEQASPSPLRRAWPFYALGALAVLYALVNLASALVSINAHMSLMGSYQRGHGVVFIFSLVAIALLIAARLRTRDQLGRLLAAAALGSVPITAYAVIQAAGADPLPWGTEQPVVASTLGNPIFLSAYLAMVISLTIAGLVALIPAVWKELQAFPPAFLRAAGYGLLLLGGLFILLLQLYALALTGARMIWLALLAGLIVFVLSLVAVPLRRTLWRWVPLGMAALFILTLLGILVIGSLTPIAQLESVVTGPSERPMVRQLIWQGARELAFTRPAMGGQPDRQAALRPWLGYGPETMYLAYPQVYQPELGRYESRTSSPDRAHNQLLDVLVTLGWVGAALFMLVWVMFFASALANISAGQGAIEAIVAGGVMAAGLAYFVDAQFDVPIVSTQLLFWVGVGVLAALACHRQKEPAQYLAGQSMVSGVAIFLLPAIAIVALGVAGLPRNWTEGLGLGSGLLIGLGVAMAAALANLAVGWRDPRAAPGYWRWLYPLLAGLLAWLSLGVFVGAALTLRGLLAVMRATLDPSQVEAYLARLESWPVLAWGFVALGLLAVAAALPRPRARLVAWSWRNLVTFAAALPVYIAIVAGTGWLILNLTIRPIQADVVYKQATPYDQAGAWEQAIEMYERATRLAPRQDFYYLFLGRAQLEQARQEGTAARRDEGLTQAQETLQRAQTLNPYNADHAANLARLQRIWVDLSESDDDKQKHADQSIAHYQEALAVSPNNPILWNELATVYLYLKNDSETAIQKLEHSLSLDAEYESTYLILGDIYVKQRDYDQAAKVYAKALEINPQLPQARSPLCYIYAEQKELDKAIACSQALVEITPDDWNAHKNLAILFAQTGDLKAALSHARKARELAPRDQWSALDAYIAQLESRLK